MTERVFVVAATTGSVWKVNVAVGDPVEVGDTVVVLEAMKMEIPVEAQTAGTVAALLVAEGDIVGTDQVLVELEV